MSPLLGLPHWPGDEVDAPPPPGPEPRAAGPAPVSASAPVQALVDALAVLAEQPAVEMPGAQAVVDAKVLMQQRELLHAVVLTRIADVDARQLYQLDAAPSTATWVAQQQTSLGRGAVALARRLPRFAHVQSELLARRLAVESGQRVVAALAKLRPHVDRPDGLIDGQPAAEVVPAVVVDGVRQLVCEALGGLPDEHPLLVRLDADLREIAARPDGDLRRLEAAFVLLAQHVEPALLPSALGRLVDALLPNELERRAAEGHERRGFDLRLKDDGTGWAANGDLDLECGELLHTVLQAEEAVDPDNPVDTREFEQLRSDGWTSADELPTCGGPRSRRQRRHDALRNGLKRYLDAGIAGMRDKAAPHISVTVGLDTLHGGPGALPAVAASGATLPASLVSAWWSDSAITRFVMSLGRKVIELSHTERTLKPHERRAKHLETGGRCQGAGCCRGPGAQLVPHHPVPWARCKTTSFEDSVLLCKQTHHDLHSGNKIIRLKDGRWLGPDGWADPPGP